MILSCLLRPDESAESITPNQPTRERQDTTTTAPRTFFLTPHGRLSRKETPDPRRSGPAPPRLRFDLRAFLAIIVLITHKKESSCAATVLVSAHTTPWSPASNPSLIQRSRMGISPRFAGGAKRLRNYVCGLYCVSLPSAVVLFSGSSGVLNGYSPTTASAFFERRDPRLKVIPPFHSLCTFIVGRDL